MPRSDIDRVLEELFRLGKTTRNNPEFSVDFSRVEKNEYGKRVNQEARLMPASNVAAGNRVRMADLEQA